MKTKAEIRKQMLQHRKKLSVQWLKEASTGVIDNLQQLEAFKDASMVALYIAVGGEVDLQNLFITCWNLDKRTCIPHYNDQTKCYEMAEITRESLLEPGHLSIPEPVSIKRVPPENIDLILVPGLAFDASGNRLGRGGGYYDRILSGFPNYCTAIAFDFQLIPQIPVDAHDEPVDAIVTESKIIKVSNEH
ncbi:MAG TPA: 5-formyltetrahydrofolate cyclo-ligase [Pontiella sp.]